jgi:hypothetical protein
MLRDIPSSTRLADDDRPRTSLRSSKKSCEGRQPITDSLYNWTGQPTIGTPMRIRSTECRSSRSKGRIPSAAFGPSLSHGPTCTFQLFSHTYRSTICDGLWESTKQYLLTAARRSVMRPSMFPYLNGGAFGASQASRAASDGFGCGILDEPSG